MNENLLIITISFAVSTFIYLRASKFARPYRQKLADEIKTLDRLQSTTESEKEYVSFVTRNAFNPFIGFIAPALLVGAGFFSLYDILVKREFTVERNKTDNLSKLFLISILAANPLAAILTVTSVFVMIPLVFSIIFIFGKVISLRNLAREGIRLVESTLSLIIRVRHFTH